MPLFVGFVAFCCKTAFIFRYFLTRTSFRTSYFNFQLEENESDDDTAACAACSPLQDVPATEEGWEVRVITCPYMSVFILVMRQKQCFLKYNYLKETQEHAEMLSVYLFSSALHS